jgi:hypothetical protein
MIIFNHPSFPRLIGAFQANLAACAPPRTAACRAPLDCQNARSALKTHTIKPNKAELKNRRNNRFRHRELSEARAYEADFHFAEEVSTEQLQKGVLMSKAFCVVGAVILAALVAAGVVAWLLGRARKEIDNWNIDPERL